MAALGFSILMREWRRGMAFDPWHGSLYLKLSTVITLSPSFSVSLQYRWRNRRAPLDLIKSKSGTLSRQQLLLSLGQTAHPQKYHR